MAYCWDSIEANGGSPLAKRLCGVREKITFPLILSLSREGGIHRPYVLIGVQRLAVGILERQMIPPRWGRRDA